jgi:hypothetical protein
MKRLQNVLFRPLLFATVLSLIGLVVAQAQPSGGRIKPAPEPTPKTTSKTPPKTNSASKGSSAKTTSNVVDRIEGKWWTTGNSFGDSEVVFTQNGSHVSGVINWADGRTGTVNGTLVNKRMQFSWADSRGDGGSGWLELSWANFLGGPWHNQRVRDGSWTLNRIEGKWCFGGKRDRMRTVTHNASGKLIIVMEDGTEEEGHLEGPWLFLHSAMGNIKGDMFYKGNRVDWANGQFWTWCGR